MRKPNNLNFRLNSKGYIYAVFYASDGKVEASIGRKCSKEQWDNKTYGSTGTARFMERLRLRVDEFTSSQDNVVKRIYKSDVEAIITSETGNGTARPVKGRPLGEAIKDYRDKMEAGEIKKVDGTRYAPSMVRLVNAVIKGLEETKYANTSIASFKESHYEDLIKYFTNKIKEAGKQKVKKRYAGNTVSIYTYILVSFFKRTRMLKWHSNTWYVDKFTNVKKDRVEGHVYLSVEEIARIYALEPKRESERYARDLFVLGCYVCLRHSDMNRLNKGVVNDGVLTIMAKKVKTTVSIPLGAVAREIWDRYKGKFKPIENSAFNKVIRALCVRAGINEPRLYTRIEGGVRVEKIRPKYQLCGTHTMRRSFATNALKAGVPIHAIMKIGGWVTEVSFWGYIRLSSEENAEDMKKLAFFQ